MSDCSTEKTDSADNANSLLPKSRGARLTLIALAIILLPFLLYRLTSPSRMLVRCDYSGIATDAPAADRSTHSTLRVATWNIAHGRGSGDSNWKEGGDAKLQRIDEIAAKIREFDADVVILNEVDFCATWSGGADQAEQIATKAGYPVCIKQANLDFGFLFGRWYFGNVILSRLPVSDAQVVPLQPLNGWEPWLVGNKRGVSCVVELPSKAKVSIVGLHLESRGEAIRVKQVDQVAQHLGTLPTPIVVAGDLNTTPGNFPNSQNDTEGINAFDKMIEQLQFSYRPDAIEDANDASSHWMTYSTEAPHTIIDWVLLSHELSFADQVTVETRLSDHRPVIATIQFGP